MSATEVRQQTREQKRSASLAGLRGWLVLSTLLVLLLGGVECWFGKTDGGDVYGSDAVQYLDCARAIERGDLKSALNPLWSQDYPALLAIVRPLFPFGPWGDWLTTRVVNEGILLVCWAAFCWFLLELLKRAQSDRIPERAQRLICFGAVCLFLTTQLTIVRTSSVSPDQLVAAFFFAACALMLKLLERSGFAWSVAFGATAGLGYVAKAAFLPIGLLGLCLLVLASWRRPPRWSNLGRLLPAAVVLAAIAGSYAGALSRAVGHSTLGESGSINYAWHVNRLQKWVHWEGGIEPAEAAWPKASIAHFARWTSDPPDFGRPVHPGKVVGSSPKIYEFEGPVTATYVPYYDPPYWYEGYRHVFRWRYQLIALGKSVVDLAQVLVAQPVFFAMMLLVGLALVRRGSRQALLRALLETWPLLLFAAAGVAIFLPVHLEGRYFAGELAVLGVLLLTAWTKAVALPESRERLVLLLLVVATAAGLWRSEHGAWSRATAGWSPSENVEWKAGTAVAAAGLPTGAEVGMISWTANLHCDWAYLAGVRITSEIVDERAFWALSAGEQQQVLAGFHRAGAQAVMTWDKPPGEAAGWRQLNGAPMWLYRF